MMSGSIFEKKTGGIIVIILLNLIAAILFASWYRTQDVTLSDKGRTVVTYADTTPESFWKKLDYAVFKNLNGTLRDNKAAQTFWALANNRAFDLFCSALLGLVLWLGVLRRGTPSEKHEQLRVGLLLFCSMVIVIQGLDLTLFNFSRPSASLIIVENTIRLSQLEHVTWDLKDSSSNSFPGDHGAVLFSGAVYIAYFASKRWGVMAFLVAFLCVLPRVVAGAHWATDAIVGSTFVMLISTSWVLGLSRLGIGSRLFYRLALFLMKLARLPLPSPVS